MLCQAEGLRCKAGVHRHIFVELEVPDALAETLVSVEKVNRGRSEGLISVICLHIVDLDAKSCQWRQILYFKWEGQGLLQLIAIESSSVEFWARLRLVEDELDLDVDLEAEVVECVVD